MTPSPTGFNLIDKLEKIKILKEKVATKVSELRQNEKSAVLGTVLDITDDTMNIKSEKGTEFNINTTEDTLYFSFDKSGKRLESTKSKVTKGGLISVFGFLQGNTMDGKYIYIETVSPLHLVGKIMDIDRKNFTLTLKSQSQEEWIIDIENFTRTNSYSPEEKTTKSGFSQLQPGDLIHIIANNNEKEKNRAAGLRIVKFVEFSPSNTVSPTPTPSKK